MSHPDDPRVIEVAKLSPRMEAVKIITERLKCPCGLNYEQSKKEPCLCPWGAMEDILDDMGLL